MAQDRSQAKETDLAYPETLAAISKGKASEGAQYYRLSKFASYAALSVALLLCLLKLGVWFYSHYIAILSSAVDGLMDVSASAITLFALAKAAHPADDNHRFGHGKAEPLAALALSGFIGGSALILVVQSIPRLIFPAEIAFEQSPLAFGVMGISIFLTLSLVGFQSLIIKKTNSMAIRADMLHYKADILQNFLVIGAVLIASTTPLFWVDALFGLGVALFLALSARKIAKESLSMLMDREVGAELHQKVIEIAREFPDVIGIHQLKTRQAGRDIFIQMHIEMNGALTLARAHSSADAIENGIKLAIPNSEVIIHIDPIQEHGGTSPAWSQSFAKQRRGGAFRKADDAAG